MTKNYLERAQDMSALYGQEMSTEEMADSFHLYAPSKRISALQQIDHELSNAEVNSEDASMRRYSDLVSFRRKLGDVHGKLLKVNR